MHRLSALRLKRLLSWDFPYKEGIRPASATTVPAPSGATPPHEERETLSRALLRADGVERTVSACNWQTA